MRVKEHSNLQIEDKVIHLRYGVCVVSDRIEVEKTKQWDVAIGLTPVTCEGRNKLVADFGQDATMIYENELRKLKTFV